MGSSKQGTNGTTLSQAKLTIPKNTFPGPNITSTSPFTTTPKPSYSQVTWRPHDCGNLSHDPTHDLSCELSATTTSHDLIAHDPGKITYDLPRNCVTFHGLIFSFLCLPILSHHVTAYLIHHLTSFLLTWPLSCHLGSTSSFLGSLCLFLLSLVCQLITRTPLLVICHSY